MKRTGTDGDSSNDNETGDIADTGDDGDPVFTEPVFGGNDGDEDLMAQLNELLCNPVDVTQFNEVDIEIIHIIIEYLQESNSGGCSEIDFDSLVAYPITDQQSLGECNVIIIKKTILVRDFSNTAFGEKIENSFFIPEDRHITIVSAVPENNNAATTSYIRVPIQTPLTGQTVVMVLNPNYLNTATDIAIVTTILHELLHAYIINLYYDNSLLTVYPQYTDLNSAFNAFENDSNYPNEQLISPFLKANLDDKMHDIYVDFIDDLAENVKGYATRNNIKINNNPISLDYARDLVWGSLQGNSVFTDNLNITEQSQANSNFNNELNNNNNGTNTKSCNN